LIKKARAQSREEAAQEVSDNQIKEIMVEELINRCKKYPSMAQGTTMGWDRKTRKYVALPAGDAVEQKCKATFESMYDLLMPDEEPKVADWFVDTALDIASSLDPTGLFALGASMYAPRCQAVESRDVQLGKDPQAEYDTVQAEYLAARTAFYDFCKCDYACQDSALLGGRGVNSLSPKCVELLRAKNAAKARWHLKGDVMQKYNFNKMLEKLKEEARAATNPGPKNIKTLYEAKFDEFNQMCLIANKAWVAASERPRSELSAMCKAMFDERKRLYDQAVDFYKVLNMQVPAMKPYPVIVVPAAAAAKPKMISEKTLAALNRAAAAAAAAHAAAAAKK